MRISELKIRNFRTLESLDLCLPGPYTAICGANDSGKTNVVRAIRALVRDERPSHSFSFPNDEELSFKDDYPKWKSVDANKREVSFELTLSLGQRNQ